MTESNGLAYVPAFTISALPSGADPAAINIVPRETSAAGHYLHNRALTSRHSGQWSGNVGNWLLAMVRQPGSKNLAHGNEPQWFTTSITDQLLDDRGSWNLGNM
jgi:hypothetical protein